MIFISDSHVCQNNLKNINTYNIFKLVVSKLNTIIDKNIVFLGDNVQDGNNQSYDLLFDQINLIKNKNIFMMAGNHDNKSLLELYCKKNNIIYCLDTPKIIENQNYYFLDSNVKNEDYGMVTQNSLDKLEEHLTQLASNKTIICMHHHAQPTNDFMDNYIIKNNNKVINVLQSYKHKIKYVISGHTHRYESYDRDGIIYYHAPSSAFNFSFLNNDIDNTVKVEFIQNPSLLTYNQKMEFINVD
ncbi:metallophosphoesterase [Thiotrichales bacterium 19X7-9]|nr:metallophosphoesterase [Thiotrichales bacterium 19X7-9]